jgi:son of sevenless-like protein
MMEGDKFRRILPRNYISYLRGQEPNNNVDAAVKTNDQIRDWVIHSILHCDQLEARKDHLLFFVLTANVILKRYC